MSPSPANLALLCSPEGLACEISREVLPWLVAGLNGRMSEADGQLSVEWPHLEPGGPPQRIAAPIEQWAWGREPASRLFEAFLAAGEIPNAQPRLQPSRVHEISEYLLKPYSAQNGRIHLGGCTMEWSPLWLVLSLRDAAPSESSESSESSAAAGPSPAETKTNVSLDKLLLDSAGRPATGEEIGLGDFESLELLPSAPSANVKAPTLDRPPLLCVPIWRSWVRGRVVAEVEDACVAVDVEGWATELASGQAKLPPFDVGSGEPSYRVAADDDGDIGPDTATAVCAESGRRLLCSKLQHCGASEVWVSPKYVLPCPVTGVRVRKSELVDCNMCCQAVAPQAVVSGRCEVCRSLKSIAKEDALVARIIGEFPRLDEYGGWRIGESRDSYVLTAGRFLWRLLIVIDKKTFELSHVATGFRWIRGWTEASEELQRELRSAQ